jgi:hypothetical protein
MHNEKLSDSRATMACWGGGGRSISNIQKSCLPGGKAPAAACTLERWQSLYGERSQEEGEGRPGQWVECKDGIRVKVLSKAPKKKFESLHQENCGS